MSWVDALIVFVGVAVISFALAASKNYSDPDKRIKLHEDMGVNFPPNTSREEKLKVLDRYGLMSGGIKRPVLIAVAVIVYCIGFFYFNA